MSIKVPALAVRGLSYSYLPDFSLRRRSALRDVSFELLEGEALGFLGRNGAGKTTTIKCIIDLVRPRAGCVSIFGLSSRNPAARKAIGFVPEQPYFYDHLTVLETLGLNAALLGISGSDGRRRVREALEALKLWDVRSMRLRSLSKGLTQRVALAQAIVGSPRLLILDEPFSGLDPLGRRDVRELLVSLKEAGTSIFISSHILSDVEFFCDRAAIIAAGELRGMFDLKRDLSLRSDRFELILRTDGEVPGSIAIEAEKVRTDKNWKMVFTKRADAEKALRAALEAGIEIESFEMVRGNLEDLFIETVGSHGVS